MPMRHLVLAAAALGAAAPAVAGIEFREAEMVLAGGTTVAREQRRVLVQDGNLKSLVEESSDPLSPPGSYLLVDGGDPVLVDPARGTLAPLVPADMQPVPAGPGGTVTARRFVVLGLDRMSEEPGPVFFGFPTRHFVYLLRYREEPGSGDPAAGEADERHEFWVASIPGEEAALATWQERRLAQDAGAGAARLEIREALAPVYARGLFFRHVIERRAPGFEPGDGERVLREITAFGRRDIAAAEFSRPGGLAATEFLAPGPDETAAAPKPPAD